MIKSNNLEFLAIDIELEYGVSAGIRLRSLGSGLVPIFEEHSCRAENGISLAVWTTMDVFEKALLIAMRRSQQAVSNLQTEAEIKHSKRLAKRGKG